MTTPTGAAPQRGWYADPGNLGHERWWTGSEWSEHTAKVQPAGMFGIDYVRSMRPGPNTSARRAMLLARIGILLFFTTFVLFFVARVTENPSLLPIMNITALVTIAFGIGAIVFGILGSRRSVELGGKAHSISALVSGSAQVLLGVLFLFL